MVNTAVGVFYGVSAVYEPLIGALREPTLLHVSLAALTHFKLLPVAIFLARPPPFYA